MLDEKHSDFVHNNKQLLHNARHNNENRFDKHSEQPVRSRAGLQQSKTASENRFGTEPHSSRHKARQQEYVQTEAMEHSSEVPTKSPQDERNFSEIQGQERIFSEVQGGERSLSKAGKQEATPHDTPERKVIYM